MNGHPVAMVKVSEGAARLMPLKPSADQFRWGCDASINVTLKGADGARTGGTVAFLASTSSLPMRDEEKPGLDRINKFNRRDPNRDGR